LLKVSSDVQPHSQWFESRTYTADSVDHQKKILSNGKGCCKTFSETSLGFSNSPLLELWVTGSTETWCRIEGGFDICRGKCADLARISCDSLWRGGQLGGNYSPLLSMHLYSSLLLRSVARANAHIICENYSWSHSRGPTNLKYFTTLL